MNYLGLLVKIGFFFITETELMILCLRLNYNMMHSLKTLFTVYWIVSLFCNIYNNKSIVCYILTRRKVGFYYHYIKYYYNTLVD